MRLLHKFIVAFSILLMSCSSPEYDEALASYHQAKKSHDIQQMVNALKILTQHAPEKFQEAFSKVKSAQKNLNLAKSHLDEGNYYLAYIASHDSYRNIPALDSKKILVKTSRILSPLLNAQRQIEKSIEYRPANLVKEYELYSSSAMSSWKLIKVNKIIEQLSRSTNALKSALQNINNQSVNVDIPGLTAWKMSIEKQLNDAQKIQAFIPNIAKHHSAQILLTLDQKLTKESVRLLSLIRPSIALDNATPLFLKAQSDYTMAQDVVANISLALNLSAKDLHSAWYVNWEKLEHETLFPKKAFERYPLEAKQREKRLNTFIKKENFILPEMIAEYGQRKNFNEPNSAMSELFKKLNRDKTLI